MLDFRKIVYTFFSGLPTYPTYTKISFTPLHSLDLSRSVKAVSNLKLHLKKLIKILKISSLKVWNAIKVVKKMILEGEQINLSSNELLILQQLDR